MDSSYDLEKLSTLYQEEVKSPKALDCKADPSGTTSKANTERAAYDKQARTFERALTKNEAKSELNTKRLARTALAVIVTVGIVVAIIVGCGPKWGNGTATGKTGSQSTATAHTAATVDVQLPSYYMDNMVFQRDQPIVVKGNVSSTESNPIDVSKLSATLTQGKTSESVKAKVAKNGSFTCTLSAQKASLNPYSLQVQYAGKTVLNLAKVYVGDVFVAAGQSNMELNYVQYYENATYNFGNGLITTGDLPKPLVDDNVKFVIANHDVEDTDFPLSAVNSERRCMADCRFHEFTAPQLSGSAIRHAVARKHPNVPIGIIQTAWGGTPIRRHVQGGDIYANHIAPLKGFHVAGVLWYQGCDDANNYGTALQYESQMTTLINQYRNVFGRKDLPFLYVQLARWPNYQYTQNVREAQRTTLGNTNLHDSSNVAMTVSLDTDKGHIRADPSARQGYSRGAHGRAISRHGRRHHRTQRTAYRTCPAHCERRNRLVFPERHRKQAESYAAELFENRERNRTKL